MNQPIKMIYPNDYDRIFTVGDIHGELYELIQGLSSVDFDFNTDLLVCVGDLIDRGEDSWGCLALALEPWCISVKGNHEDMMFNALLEGKYSEYVCWQGNGGGWWKWGKYLPPVQKEWLASVRDSMPVRLQVGDIGFCHAMPPLIWDSPTEDETDERIMWGRKHLGKDVVIEGIDHVYVGHTPHYSIETHGNITYLDTGVCFNMNYGFDIVEITDELQL